MARTSKEKVLLSQETLDRYKKEYHELVTVERPAVQAALKEARAQGDLSENAEYDAARDRQSEVEGRILELEHILERATVIQNDSINMKKAGIGATVKYLNMKTNEEKVVTIMGVHDSNPIENKISNESPVAQAIMEANIGDVVEVEVAQKYNIKVLDIFYAN
ncbi:transcription elongation factor GreA [Mycoplasma tauri]|uniref:Transcription elongation factor GreA n=1 Tax=Mycoplasma tauri TaxID=547987 RepID=A0A953NH26_9MOLU|nr:transcription elongation factor GreA [Mycoplasma tauri]MBZ4195551.1 transcription elongation factor GreA [Mycoplasma tauri]MBZ4203494.1 transcription elongation factor GreA [Mycoplasma tauri]MBZ4204134.1 transcription elongation factor GreA [Mycoplasma tauri]MBZ4212464.1 transcription elongation factor GreA [Mycoplasma tauri]MBZ4218109.1 transcription elongation factor GreA [Mycoplasma tauri]